MGPVKSLPEQQAVSDTIKSGYLLKESKHLKTYRKRFMVLKGTTIISYKTHEQEKITEFIDLLTYPNLEESSAILFFVASSKDDDADERAFRAESKKDMQEWVKCIRNVYASHSNPKIDIQNHTLAKFM